MKIFKYPNLIYIFLIFFINIFFFNFYESKAIANEDILTKSNRLLPEYQLGPGDRLLIKIFGYKDYSSNVIVLPDGTINLTRIGTLNVNGLTINEARNELTSIYSKIFKKPIIYLDLVEIRPIRITITGEVNSPGIYTLSVGGKNIIANNDGGEKKSIETNGWPTLVDAIQRGGGITNKGDLRNVTLFRKNKKTLKTENIIINYWDTLKFGTPTKNYYVYDGDSVRIPPVKDREYNELNTISSSSFAPSTITINLVGAVENPGPQTIKNNSPLSKAILNAGGLTNKSNKNKIALIRLNDDGTISKSIYSFQPSNRVNNVTNPPLINGDVIVVEKNSWSKSTETIKTIVEPFSELVTPLTIYRFFNN